MKALLLHDFYILKKEYKNLGIVLLICTLFMLVMSLGDDHREINSMFPIIMGSTMAMVGLTGYLFTYDEKSGYMQYLFVTPTMRKTYVSEKFVILALHQTAGMLAGMVLSFAGMAVTSAGITGEDVFRTVLFSAGIWAGTSVFGIWFTGLCIRFGSGKARIACVLLILAVSLGSVGLSAGLVIGGAEGSADSTFLLFLSLVGALLLAGTVFLFVMSYVWVRKKEF